MKTFQLKPEPNRKKYIDIMRKMSGENRLKIGFELFDMATKIMIDGIKSQNPNFGQKEIQKEVVRRMLQCHKRNSLEKLCKSSIS